MPAGPQRAVRAVRARAAQQPHHGVCAAPLRASRAHARRRPCARQSLSHTHTHPACLRPCPARPQNNSNPCLGCTGAAGCASCAKGSFRTPDNYGQFKYGLSTLPMMCASCGYCQVGGLWVGGRGCEAAPLVGVGVDPGSVHSGTMQSVAQGRDDAVAQAHPAPTPHQPQAPTSLPTPHTHDTYPATTAPIPNTGIRPPTPPPPHCPPPPSFARTASAAPPGVPPAIHSPSCPPACMSPTPTPNPQPTLRWVGIDRSIYTSIEIYINQPIKQYGRGMPGARRPVPPPWDVPAGRTHLHGPPHRQVRTRPRRLQLQPAGPPADWALPPETRRPAPPACATTVEPG